MNLDKIKELRASLEAKQKEFNDLMRVEFQNGTKELFEENPGLESFSFRGYSPYFNDGEECVFSAHTYCPDINGEEGYKNKELMNIVEGFLTYFDDNFYLTLFGNHWEVTVTKDNIEVSEYSDHD